MFEFISVGSATIFLLYFFIAGMIIAEDKELLKSMSWSERLVLALLIIFWPVSVLIGKGLELLDSVWTERTG